MWVSIMQLKLVSDSHCPCPEFDRTGSAKRWMGGFILPKLNLLSFMQELKVETKGEKSSWLRVDVVDVV